MIKLNFKEKILVWLVQKAGKTSEKLKKEKLSTSVYSLQ